MKENERPKGAVVTDPEAVAIHRIAKTLSPMSPRAKRRLLTYLIDLLDEEVNLKHEE
jgi:hypothetical protein